MAKQMWISEDGQKFETEIEALRVDVGYWKQKAKDAESRVEHASDRLFRLGAIDNPRSSYGSSGGGGHD